MGARLIGQGTRTGEVAAKLLDAGQLREREPDAGRAFATDRMFDSDGFAQQRLRLIEATERQIDATQVVHARRDVRIRATVDAARDADALLIVTEWQVFRSPDFDALRAVLRQPLVVDGRNLYEPRSMRALGFDYLTVGRNAVDAPGATTP